MMPPTAGRPLDISLGWRVGSNGHLTDGEIFYRGSQLAYLVTSLGRSVYALGDDGAILWEARTEGPAYAVAVLDGQHVAVGDDAGDITLLDGEGRRLWRHDLGSRVTALKAGWPGTLVAGGWQEGRSNGGQVTLFSTESEGEGKHWQIDLESPVTDIAVLAGSPATGFIEGDLAVAGTLDGEVRAVDHNGSEVWRFDAGVPVTVLTALETVEAKTILVGLQDGRLLALDTGGARSKQSPDYGSILKWQQTFGEGGPVLYTADLVGDLDPEIVVGTGGKAPVLALLSSEGQMLWRVAMASPVNAIQAVDIDRDSSLEVLAGLASGEIQAFDEQGRLRGSIHAGLPVWGLEASGNGAVFARADVVAWQIKGVAGPTGGSWLPPPPMVSISADWRPPELGKDAVENDKLGGATLVFLGDIAPGRSMEAQLVRYGSDAPWEGLAPLLRTADLAVANLECVLSTGGQPRDKQYLIRAHPRWSQMLVAGGLDLVSMANNHALDYEQIGLDETLEGLGVLEVAAVGAGTSQDSSRVHQAALFNLNGVRVAVLGYAAARWNGSVDVPATDRIAWAEPVAVQADVRLAQGQADIVIVLLHAGTEYADEPSADQVAFARAAVDAGADLVVGHHPHVTQIVERYRGGLIVYSLGDAVFDIPRPAAMLGHLLRARVTTAGLQAAELWPFWIEDAFRPQLLDDGEGTPVFENIYP
jgi:poly-gamma-glutamate synthesis protein (capsule biosynthesis protein)